jgi:hypothetical protein
MINFVTEAQYAVETHWGDVHVMRYAVFGAGDGDLLKLQE